MKLVNLNALARDAEDLPDEGVELDFGTWINGRVIGVLASPDLGNADHIASGVSVVPAGSSTPWHSHEAEEVAVIAGGSGVIDLNGEVVEVVAGDVVVAPSNIPHQTRASQHQSLAVFWVYSPPGSEVRWLSEGPVKED